MRRAAFVGLALVVTPAMARVPLGSFDRWGAFRDDVPLRCFAIAEPVRRTARAAWRPFASVAIWPRAGVRGQVHVRLSRAVYPNAPVTLAVGDTSVMLVASGADAWAPDPRADAAIVAAMRSAPALTVTATNSAGGRFADSYALKGAATAIDAAQLGCAHR